MPRDLFGPTPEQQNVVLVDAPTLRKAERLIDSCEHCNEEDARIPFDNILDRVTGSDPNVTDYISGEVSELPSELLGKCFAMKDPLLRLLYASPNSS